jgi:outer membrane protein assembly factor BamB
MRRLHTLALAIALTAFSVLTASGTPVELLWEFPSTGHHIRCVSAIEDQEDYVPGTQDVLIEIDNSSDPDGHLKLLSGSTGEILWETSPPGGVSGGCGYGDMCLTSSPDLSGDWYHEALLGTSWGGRTAYALLANNDGRIFWYFDTYIHASESGWVYSIDWINDVTGDGKPEVIFGCGSDNNTAYCMDGGHGTVLWHFPCPDAVYQVAPIGDVNGNGTDDVLVATGDADADYTYCFEGGSSGVPWYIWRFYVGATSYTTTGGDDANGDSVPDAYIGTWDSAGTVYCVSGADGSEIWSQSVGPYQYVMRVVTIEDLNDDGCDDLLVASWNNAIICLDGATGDALWNVSTGTTNGGDVWTIWPLGDVDYDGYKDVIAGSFDLKAYCVSGRTGDLLWDYTVGNRVYTVRGIRDVNYDQVGDALVGTQYYGGTGGKVYCLDADGNEGGIPPAAELSCVVRGEAVVVEWSFDPSADLAGFNVYRSVAQETETPEELYRRLSERGLFTVERALAERAGLGPENDGRENGFTRLNDELVQGSSFTDASAVDGTRYLYMVGAVSEDGTEVLTGPVEVLADFRAAGVWLAPPAPNPFASSSTFEFAAPRDASATIAIYTPGGRLVRRLEVAGESGRVSWDGRSDEGRPVAPGVYLVRLEAGGSSAHRKVVFLR